MAKRGDRTEAAQRRRLQIRINHRILILFEESGFDKRIAEIAIKAHKRLQALEQKIAAPKESDTE